MPCALQHSDLFLYADDSCIVFQSKDINNVQDKLTQDFSELCDWFVDNKLSIHFGQDKTKCIIFGTKRKLSKIENFSISYDSISISRHKTVSYLGCILDEFLTGENMACAVISKINSRLRFLHRKNDSLSPKLRRMLCNALIQPLFDFACCSWFSNLSKKSKKKLQICQNKCIRFCLQLPNRTHIDSSHFLKINWLNVDDRVSQMICSHAFKFFNNSSPKYMGHVFQICHIQQETLF